jgi:hypothetical protein
MLVASEAEDIQHCVEVVSGWLLLVDRLGKDLAAGAIVCLVTGGFLHR